MERRETLLSLDLELKTNLKGLLQFTCPVLGINHSGVCVFVCGAHIQSRHVQRALYMRLRAHLFRFRVVLVQLLLKVKPFTSQPPMALL